jgi:hypothetical protein
MEHEVGVRSKSGNVEGSIFMLVLKGGKISSPPFLSCHTEYPVVWRVGAGLSRKAHSKSVGTQPRGTLRDQALAHGIRTRP